MPEENYFQKALSNFTFEAASGGAIRHMADQGYSVKRIMEELSFPTPYERVQKTVWEHLLDQKIILLEEPGKDNAREKVTYVTDYGKYGRKSFRKVITREETQNEDTTVKETYALVHFGIIQYQDPKKYQKILEVLDSKEREYIEGLPWPRQIVYHKTDSRMKHILEVLKREGLYTVY